MSHALFYITAAVYLGATLIFCLYLVTHREGLAWSGEKLLFLGGGVHALSLAARWVEGGRFPATSLYESLSLLAWLMVVLFIIMASRHKVAVVGAFVAPLALLFTITATLVPADIEPLAPALNSYWLPVHVTLAILGNAFFGMACVFGFLYIVQDRHLKKRKIKGLYFVLPSLEVLDELNYRCLRFGFPLLTLGIISGALWSEYTFGTYWIWKHRQVWSLITWCLYAALLHGRMMRGWRGRKSAVFSVVAFCILLLSSFIIYLLLGEGHGLLE